MVIVLQYIPYPTAQPIGTLAYWHIDKLFPPPENKSVAVSVDTRNK